MITKYQWRGENVSEEEFLKLSSSKLVDANLIREKKELKERQAKFCGEILNKISDMVSLKYWRGAEEHGGCLGDMSAEELLDNIEEEAIDMLVYVAALRIKQNGK